MSEKTEKPTQKHLRDARKKGQVVKSEEITSGVQLAVLFAYFSFQGQALVESIKALILATLQVINVAADKVNPHAMEVAANHIAQLFLYTFAQFIGVLGVLLIISTVFAVMAQTGPLLAVEALEIKLSKLNPLENLKQLVSMKTLFEFLKSTLKLVLLSLIFFYLLRDYLSSLQFLPLCGANCGLVVTAQFLSWMWAVMLGFYIIFGIADYAFQHHTVMKQLKMSKEDVKREYKESDGNPEIKQERKKMHQEIQSGSLAKNVGKSSVVVRNPQHIAICLYYQKDEMPVPQVIEKGKDARALHIVALAEKAGVPVVEHIPVARALMANTPVGETIPAELFEPVAQILRVVMQINYEPE